MALECPAVEVTSPKSVASNRSEEESSEPVCSVVAESPASSCFSITDLPPSLVSEILRRLDAKDLGIVLCVSTLLNSLASENQGWKKFYYDRWGPPLPAKVPSRLGTPNERVWKDMFMERESMSRAFMGRFSADVLRGHTEAVRSVFLLASAKLVFTGGYDSVIRVWDMEDGLSVATSHPLGCTVRAITADMELLVAGGTGAFLQCWKAVPGHPLIFDVSGHDVNLDCEFRLWGHGGPVTCLAMDSLRLISGSWDMSVRIWDRATLKCTHALRHGDWVWSLVPRGSTVATTSGRDVYVWDIVSGSLLKVIEDVHEGNTISIARNYLGDILFTGGEDGAIHMFDVVNWDDGHDVRSIATWVPHSAAVNSLSFEFPWLVSCSTDGRLALIDVRKLLKPIRLSSFKNHCHAGQVPTASVEPPQRMLHISGCGVFSVDIGADRIVCGCDEGSIRVWNFSQALETEKRVQNARRIRIENRMRRKVVQIEMNSKGGRSDRCSMASKRNQVNGEKIGVWYSKRSLAGKLKA